MTDELYTIWQDGDNFGEDPRTRDEAAGYLRAIAEAMRADAYRIERMANHLEDTGDSVEYAGSYLDLEAEKE